MILSVIKFFHIICGVSFFGIVIASFFYIARSISKNDGALIAYSIKSSYFGDGIIILCIIIQFLSSFSLMAAKNYTTAIPWILIAFYAYSFIIILWLFTIFTKKFYLLKKITSFFPAGIFYLLNSFIILIFIMIIHDAVMHRTGFEFLFRK